MLLIRDISLVVRSVDIFVGNGSRFHILKGIKSTRLGAFNQLTDE